MDLKILMATCASGALAEMGDKTQLAVLGATAATGRPLEVFLGAVGGLILATTLGVLVGQVAGHLLPARTLRVAGGLLFVGIGLLLLLGRGE